MMRPTHEPDILSSTDKEILDGAYGITADTSRPFCKPMESPQHRWGLRATGEDDKNKFYGVDSASGNTTAGGVYPNKYTKFVDFRIISRYNFKGGVGKTTGTFGLAWELAKKSKVLMVDADVQRSLTKLVLGRDLRVLTENENYDEFFDPNANKSEAKYPLDGNSDLFSALAPVLCAGLNNFDSLAPAQPFSVGGTNGKLCLLPSHKLLDLLEQELAKALFPQDVPSQNKLGAFFVLMQMTACFHGFQYIVVDLPPSPGALTRTSLMSSHYFQIPFFPDFFSCEAIKDLKKIFTDQPLEANTVHSSQGGNPSVRQQVNYYISQQQTWLKWLQDRCDSLAPVNFKIPNMKKLGFDGGFQEEDYSCGPKFLGGHLTRFAAHFKKPEITNDTTVTSNRVMVGNAEHWFKKTMVDLREFNASLPVSLQLDAEALGDEWLAAYGHTIGVTEDYNQLASIAQRDSLPVAQLKDGHLKKPNPNGGNLQTISSNERLKMNAAITRHKFDIAMMVKNMTTAE